MSIEIILTHLCVCAGAKRSAHPGTKCHTMDACGHGIISTDIIPVPTEGSAHPGTECHTIGACDYGIIPLGS